MQNNKYKLLTRKELANFLGLSTRTISRFIEQGDLRCVKLGHQIRFRESDIEEFLTLNELSN